MSQILTNAEIVVKNGRIAKILPQKNGVKISTEKGSLFFENAVALPGFIDNHGHVAALGRQELGLKLSDAKSARECAERAADFPPSRSGWILGRGWNETLWQNPEIPNAKILDELIPDVPALLVRIDGHAAWANSKALKICGVTKATPDPLGGKIERDDSGNPSGILIDNAIDLIKSKIPPFSREENLRFAKKAASSLAQTGLLGAADMDLSPDLIETFKRADENGELPIKIAGYINAKDFKKNERAFEPFEGKKFALEGVKFYADGSLGSRSAAFLKPYADSPNSRGILALEEKTFREDCVAALEKGFAIATHAIGDAAVRLVLKTYARLFEEKIADDASILRIEHAQHASPEDLRYFEKYPIIASVQPFHCVSDVASITEKRLGLRDSLNYPWKSLLKAGAFLVAGSDFPIETPSPFAGIDAFVNRVPLGADSPWEPEERLTLPEALKAYRTAPKNSFLNFELSLKPNAKANFIIVDRNPFCFDSPNQRKEKILASFFEGETTFDESSARFA